MKDKFLVFDEHRMTGIVPALESNDDVRVPGQQIDNLPFALVPPLSTNDHDIRHVHLIPEPLRFGDSALRSSLNHVQFGTVPNPS